MRVALVCDWLTTPGGAEKVLLELHRMYPDAPIYTSQYRPKKIDWFKDATVHTGWLQIFPAALRKFLGPLRQIFFSRLDLSSFDLVISVTGAEAKSVKTTRQHPDGTIANTPHLCYCHVPTQYYWQFYDQYLKNPGFGILNPIARLGLKLLVKPLRRADLAAAAKPTQFITISSYAAAQIKKYYHREAVIIAPPVETSTFSTKKHNFSTKSAKISTKSGQKSTATVNFSTKNPQVSPNTQELSTVIPHFSTTFPQDFHRVTQKAPKFVISCRQVTWKRVDLAIQACLKLNLPLTVIGDGPEHKNLVKLARGSDLIEFVPWVSPNRLATYLQHAKAYLFPSMEPFGIAAVEALASGCPVIAYAEGGSRDFVQSGKNGLLFPHQTVDSLCQALQSFHNYHFDPADIASTATQFDVKNFRTKISQLVQATLKSTPNAPKSQEASKSQRESKSQSASKPKGAKKCTN